jgi:hypothetical protein
MRSIAVLVLGSLLVACGGGGGGGREARSPETRGAKVEANTNWEKLGERWVDGKVDRDTIAVGRAEGKFTAIQIKVEQSALEMFDVVVTFGDGSTWSPPTRLTFSKDSSSRVIDLPGDKRIIKKVDFKYGNLPGGGRAQVELWGR